MDYSHKMPEIEHRLSDLTIEQGMRGVQIDVGRLNEYIVRSHEMLGETTKLIPWMQDDASDDWDEFNLTPTATLCIEEQCRRAGIVPPPKKTKDAEGYLEWEALHVKNHPWITAVSSWRSINKLYKTFVLVKRRLDENDVMPFSLKYFGAHTGRWSGDARLNMQNMRKLPVVCNENGLMETNERRVLAALDTFEQDGAFPSWVRHTLDFRALIIPRPGKKMIVSDLSQIEPRVLAWVAGNQKFLELVAQGYSPYEAHAKASMKYTEPTPLKDTDAGMYKLAKARVLGLGYGCGWEKFITVAYAMARLDITKDDPEFIDETNPYTGVVTKVSGYGAGSKAIVKQFRADNPEITNLWKSLDEKFKGSVGEDFKVTLPSGRVMRYEDVRASLAIEQDRVTKKPTKTWKFTAMSDARRKAYYGGKLTENIVQAIARDVFGVHVIRMEDRGWRNLFSAHDEAILEVDQSVTAKDVEKEMGHCPEWLKGCPIAAEAKEVSHYLK
jgi:DNA polymerase